LLKFKPGEKGARKMLLKFVFRNRSRGNSLVGGLGIYSSKRGKRGSRRKKSRRRSSGNDVTYVITCKVSFCVTFGVTRDVTRDTTNDVTCSYFLRHVRRHLWNYRRRHINVLQKGHLLKTLPYISWASISLYTNG